MNKKLTLALAALTLSAATASAQTIKVAKDYDVQITGSLQTDFLVPQEDNKIGTGTYDDKVLNNTYAEVHALSKYVDAGVRLEYLDHPLPGFDKDFKGWGEQGGGRSARCGRSQRTGAADAAELS